MKLASVTDYFEKDHDRLDGHFAEFQRLKRSDYPAAKQNFKAFLKGLKRHIVWEEEVLFPLFERKTGMKDFGPTAVMRAEHLQIAAALDVVHEKVRAADPDSDAEERALLDVLKAHNMKEEQVLYPAIDQGLALGELEAVAEAMEAIPEDGACCGGHGHHH